MRLHHFGLAGVVQPKRYRPAGSQVEMWKQLDDPIARLGLMPSIQTYYKGAPFSTNEYGFRDRSFVAEGNPDVTRIAVLGGSVAMGEGVSDDEIYSRRLQDILDQTHPGRYEVLNFAIAGYQSKGYVRLYDMMVSDYKPDIVMCAVHYNTWDTPLRPKREPSAADDAPWWKLWKFDLRRWLSQVSFAYIGARGEAQQWLRLHGSDWQKQLAVAKTAPTQAAGEPDTNRGFLDTFISERRAEGIPVVIVCLKQSWEFPLNTKRAVHNAMARWGEQLEGAYLIDAHDVLDAKINIHHRIYPGDNHPNAEAHNLYAEAIAEKLLPILEQLDNE